jgi:hypothetical protein
MYIYAREASVQSISYDWPYNRLGPPETYSL